MSRWEEQYRKIRLIRKAETGRKVQVHEEKVEKEKIYQQEQEQKVKKKIIS